MTGYDAWKPRAPDDEYPWCDDETPPEDFAEEDERAEMEAADREAGEC